MEYKKILVGIDGSDHSRRGALCARDMADKYQASITLLSVVKPAEYSLAIESQAFIESLQEFHTGLVDSELEEISKEGVKIDSRIALGTPWKELCRIAEEGEYDLIVLGSRGVGHMTEFIMGSTSTRVAQHAKVPVLIVP